MIAPVTFQPNGPTAPSQQLFGLVIPGAAVRTDFLSIDASGLKFALQLSCPGDISVPLASITDMVFFLLPNIPLPADYGVICYWKLTAVAPSTMPGVEPPSTEFEMLGAVTPDRPSATFHTGWGEHEQLLEVTKAGTPVILTIGASLEPLANIHNVGAVDRNQGRLFVAQKIALDLFRFMQSFDTGAAGAGNMVVPSNIFDRWFQRFENRFRRDPNFFLKNSVDA